MAYKEGYVRPRADGTKWKPKDEVRLSADVFTDIGNTYHMPKSERTGYDTQKPLALLGRIIEASSNYGDLALDTFCGCATTCMAAAGLNRRWIGIDQNEKAVEIFHKRLEKVYYTSSFETNFPSDAKSEKPIPLPQREVLGYSKISIKKAKLNLVQCDHRANQTPYCRGCFGGPGEKFLEVDHILAKAKGGLDEMGNLQLLCGNCNKRKGDEDMDFLYEVLDRELHQKRPGIEENRQGDWAKE